MSKEALIDKILSDGEKEVQWILDAAKERADNIISEAKECAKKEMLRCEERAHRFLPEQERRICSVAELERKKLLTAAKQEVVDKTFCRAVNAIKSLSDDEYLSIIKGMIVSSAEDGDTVIVSKLDKERVTEAFIGSIAKKLNIRLTLSKEYGDFDGGVLLSSEGYDKNLTLESELALIREREESNLVEILFS